MGCPMVGIVIKAIGAAAKRPDPRQKSFWFMVKDGGFTSTGVVIALALTIALLFTSAQVYWVNSTAGDIQFAADAGALAAENVVAEYYVVARIADAVVLSLSLFGLTVYGIAIVLSCIPLMQEAGASLMNFGDKVFKARDNIAKQAQDALIKLQKALPFLAAVNASSVISANSFSAGGEARYLGFAILVPLEGETVEFPDDEAVEDTAGEMREQNEKTGELTDAAASAREAMDKAKLDGYLADCGDEPNYCMYERAGSLADLHGAQNPNFSSVDLWQFDYALDRARAYYKKRLEREGTGSSILAEQIRSNARKQFYAYAVEEMYKGYARTDADGVLEAYFPLLARNSSEVRGTRLYTDCFFPVDSSNYLHGALSCPEIAGGIASYGSVAQLEAGVYKACPVCDVDIDTIGKVASATTSISNGFEFYYRIVADAADRYKKASKEYRELTEEAEESAGDALDMYDKALEELKVKRLDPKPPGRNGCIVIAFDLSTHAVPVGITSSFVSGTSNLSPRLAISAAALAEDGASEGNTILASFLDRTQSQITAGSSSASPLGLLDGVLEVWGNALLVYSQGADSLARTVGDFISTIPLVKETPLASWAQTTLQETIEAFGLQGVKLSTPKPVVVNSIHVIKASDSKALSLVGDTKEAYSSLPGPGSGTISEEVFDGLIIEIERRGSEFLESDFTIYTISFGDMPGLPQIPIKITLPPAVVDRGRSLLSEGLDQVKSLFGG